jgi:uncharacterized protein
MPAVQPRLNLNMPDLPLLDLFNYLRERDLPLGIDEYLLMLHALQAGYGGNREGLFRLCLRLWAKNREDESLIEEYFYQFPTQVDQATSRQASQTEQAGERLNETPDQNRIRNADPSVIPLDDNTISQREMNNTDFTQPANGQVRIRPRQSSGPNRTKFNLSGEYFPLSQRQMKQSWRYLRRMQRRGVSTELDIPATVERVGREGLLYEPELKPPRANAAELLMLVDRDGSMVPFHDLGEQLARTAAGAGRLGKFEIFYFHNYPPCEDQYPNKDFYFFRTLGLAFDTPLNDILKKFDRDDTSILIFSDAGAARGKRSSERVVETTRFLTHLKRQNIHSLAWLNPMPRERWDGTSAEAIKIQIPMFDLSRSGMASLIESLRRQCGGNLRT